MTDTDYSSEISDIITALQNIFQDKLASGTNIKTINNNSLLGSGNLTITGTSLVPDLVYTCSSFSSYIDSGATNNLQLYKLGNIYLLRYFISTNSLTYSTTDYNINDDQIGSDYRPVGNRTFHVATSSNHNAKITITTAGKVTISTDANSTAISLAGTVIYWW